jgi:ribosomal protein S18 acetylase RimI-like enzyme
VIRAATRQDLEHLVHHRVSMFRDMGHRDEAMLEQVAQAARLYFVQAIDDGSYRAWLAEDTATNIVAGAGVVIAAWPGSPLDLQPRRAWILNVYTEPAWRRRGLARRLMEIVLAWCRAERFSTVSLHASDEGRALYESLGFKRTNEMRLEL